jgi:hypothetical protein
MKTTFNLKETQAPSYSPVPEDRYEVEVVEVMQGNTQAGDIMLNIKFAIVSPIKFAGRSLWANMSLGDKAIGFFKVFLEAIQSPLVDSAEATLDEIIQDMSGRRATCVAIPGKTPTGKDKNDLRHWKPIDLGNTSTEQEESVNLVK